MSPEDMEYDAVTEWLRELARKLDRAENEMMSDGKNAFATGAIRKWWQAYLNFHCARIDCEEAKYIPCPECAGDGSKDHPCDDAPAKCYECDGTGHYICDACGEAPAVTHIEDYDALCATCEGEGRW